MHCSRLAAPAHGPLSPAVSPFSSWMADFVVVALFQVKINLFNYEFAFLVLLAGLVSSEVSPANHALAALTENVAHRMKTSHETPLFALPESYINTLIE